MDNDNKIDTFDDSKQESKEVSLFLQEELIPLKKKKTLTTYNLEKEYAKTKKNINYSIWIIMAITVAAVVLATWLTISGLSAKNNKLQVSLESFEDLNLRNLFDALSKTQDLYEKAAKAKAELEASLESRLTQAKRNKDVDFANLSKMKLARKQRLEKEAEIIKRYNSIVFQAHEDLDEKLKAAELELKQYEEQLKSFDSENVAKAQTWEREMDSQRQVHEIETLRLTEEYENQLAEMKKQMTENNERNYQERRMAVNDLTTHYEARIAKLDPAIKDNKVIAVIERASALGPGASINVEAINQNVAVRDDDYTAELNETKRKFDDFLVLSNYAQTIPYSNGMTGVVASERQIAYDMTYSIARTGAERISKLKSENIQLSTQLDNSKAEASRLKNSLNTSNGLLDNYAKSVKADGFILSYSPGSAAVIFVASSVKANVKNDGSSKGTVYDGQGTVVATGSLWFKDSVYYLTLDEEIEELPYGAIVKIK